MTILKTTLITHIFNEEYLLPFWLNHHKYIFDDLIVINYHSTDNSIHICKSIWPDCKIITSRNNDFDAICVDSECMDIEDSIDGIKMILNITEFLICDKPIKTLFHNNIENVMYGITSYSPCSQNNYEVKNNCELFGNLLNPDVKYYADSPHYRAMHNFPNGGYGAGRHFSNLYHYITIQTVNVYIVKFSYYPMNDKLLKRKIQIGQNVPQSDIDKGLGTHHLFSKEKHIEIINNKCLTGLSLQDINSTLCNLLTRKYINKKNIALIGCCGYVGTMIYDYLLTNPNVIISCYGTTLQNIYPPHITTLASEITPEVISKFDVVIYLAGLSGPQICQSLLYDKVYNINVTEPLLLASKMNKKQLFIYASTGLLCKNDNNLHDNFDHYEKSMYERELLLNAVTNTQTIGLRLGTVIGVSDNMRSELFYNGNSMLQLCLSAITTNCIQIWNINNFCSILWIEDLKNVINILIENKDTFTNNYIFNISSFNTTIHDFATIISNKLHCNLRILDNLKIKGYDTAYSSQIFSNMFKYKFLGTTEVIIDDLIQNKDFIEKSINLIGKCKKCIICNSILLTPVINLGNQPLANDFNKDKHFTTETFPLNVNRCQCCFHSQLDYFVDREILFKNYIYKSGTSKTLCDYFSSFAELYSCKMKNVTNRNILELACNDGNQLDEFKKRNWNTYGVDPASNIIKFINLNHHNIKCGFWGKDKIHFTETFNLIVAQNVLAHVNNPVRFLSECVSYMNEDTLLVIQTSQSNMFINNEFDTIYHEHISFFNIRSMLKLVEKCECHIEHVYKTHIHGSSYVFEIKKGYNDNITIPLLMEEESQGLYSDTFYTNYSNSIEKFKTTSLNLLQKYKSEGYKVIAYGAAAKGTTFLNYIFSPLYENECIPECIIDDSELKENTYMPGVKIIVKNIFHINTYINDKIVIIVTAWNFYDEILNRISNFLKLYSLNIQVKTIAFYPSIKEDNLA